MSDGSTVAEPEMRLAERRKKAGGPLANQIVEFLHFCKIEKELATNSV